MKLILDVKGKKALNPSEGDILIYQNGSYYVTTKEEILSESFSLLEKCRLESEELKKRIDDLKADNEDFKKTVAGQLMQMSDLIKELYSK